MRSVFCGLAAGVVLAAASGAASAAIATFDTEYRLVYSREATLDPATGQLVIHSVEPRTYTGSFRFTLESVDESVSAGPSPGLLRRTVQANLSFEPFDFAPDLQALVDGDAPGLPPSAGELTGRIRFERLEDLAGSPASFVYEEMSNLFFVNESQFSLTPFPQSYAQYRSIRAELGDPATPMSVFLASADPGDIAAYLLATPQVWQTGNTFVSWPNGFSQPQGPFTGRNSAGGLRFTAITVTGGVAPVPEPATWALMIAGFGLAGSALRRRGLATG